MEVNDHRKVGLRDSPSNLIRHLEDINNEDHLVNKMIKDTNPPEFNIKKILSDKNSDSEDSVKLPIKANSPDPKQIRASA